MSKFNEERAADIIRYLRQGSELTRAAQRARVTRQTVWNWRRQGRHEGEGPKYEFDLEIQAIEAEQTTAAENTVKRIMTDRTDNRSALNAAKWYLEKRAPEEYGTKATLAIQIRQEMALEMLDYLRERLDARTYDVVVAALAPTGGGGAAPPKLNS